MKETKRLPRTFPALAWRIISLVLALWLGCMSILTCSVAADMQTQLEHLLRYYTDLASSRMHHDDAGLPGTVELNMIDSLGLPYFWLNLEQLFPFVEEQHFDFFLSSDDWMWGKWDLYYGYEVAVIYYDENKQELLRTGDYLTFDYTTPERWAEQDIIPIGKGYIALDNVPGGSERFDSILESYPVGDLGMWMFMPLLRLTGWFEGNQFHPTLIENGDYLDFYSGRITDTAHLAALDKRGSLEWHTQLSCEVPEGQDLVTIYAMNPGGYNCTPKTVTVHGQTFDTLADLLHADTTGDDPFTLVSQDLRESVFIQRSHHEDPYGKYMLAVAVRCQPLLYAAMRLVRVYLLTFLVVVIILCALLRRIRRELAAPLKEMSGAARDGYTVTPASRWSEPAILENYFVQTSQTLAENKTEIHRLSTALEYAQDAEEKRKTLISNITHELKTPLAIIHSYAECLQENVLPEKRAQYISTILEETERMDSLVLQMLELSRLEAGRVRLATDTFSLLELTKDITKNMKPLLEERGLVLSYDFVQDFVITADEGRIRQVITNLMSNAQKYATENGEIRIKIFLSKGNAYFQIENSASHLSEEALSKVFDSFYRADASRNTPGTGLGLSLVKSIISLHGGSVSAQNTIMNEGNEGVMFSFQLPLM